MVSADYPENSAEHRNLLRATFNDIIKTIEGRAQSSQKVPRGLFLDLQTSFEAYCKKQDEQTGVEDVLFLL